MTWFSLIINSGEYHAQNSLQNNNPFYELDFYHCSRVCQMASDTLVVIGSSKTLTNGDLL